MADSQKMASKASSGGQRIDDVIAMRDKIGIGVKHDNYEDLIVEAEKMLLKYKTTADSAVLILSG